MKSYRLLALSIVLICTICSSALVAAPPVSEVRRIKLVNNNHLPQKIIVAATYSNRTFVKDMFKVIKFINESEQLQERDIVKLHLISSGGNPISSLGISAADAAKYVEVNPSFTTSDLWMRDAMEIMSVELKNGKYAPAIFDTNRGRGLAGLPKALAQLWDLVYFKNPSNAQSKGDYGGNILITPFEDVLVAGSTMTAACKRFFEQNGYAGRIFSGNTHWLTVGHIDEYVNFIPTAHVPGGYSIVRADPLYALEIIRNLPDNELDKISQYDRRFLLGVKRVLNEQLLDSKAGANTAEGRFIALNYELNELIEENIGQLVAFIRHETKDPNRDFEVVSWPTLYEGRAADNSRSCRAFLPGVVNMLVVRDHLIVPATHIPAFDKAIEARFKAQGNKVHFVDDTPYHTSMGEIHCGTNALRDIHRTIITREQVQRVQDVKDKFKQIHNR